MNFKTTAILVVVLLVVLGWFLVAEPEADRLGDSADGASSGVVATWPVFEGTPEPSDIVRLVATPSGREPWRFERRDDEGVSSQWMVVEPAAAKVVGWEIDSICRKLCGLEYQIKYVEGADDAVTPAQAGLVPPRVEIEMTDGDGNTYAIEIGKTASPNETYVRVKGSKEILVARATLTGLLKDELREYRDKSMVRFTAADVVSLEILHQPEGDEPVVYRVVKRGDDWWFEEPFSARANKKAITDAINAAGRLRATEWATLKPDHGYGFYGLTSPWIDVEITTEAVKEVAKGDDDSVGDAESEKETETVVEHVGFRMSDRSPLGQNAWIYCRMADDDGVATISRAIAEKFIPKTETWRDLSVVHGDVSSASRVDIALGKNASASLVKDDMGNWVFGADAAPVESSVIEGLLKTIRGLKALNFVDRFDASDSRFGLSKPSAVITLHVDGEDQPIRLTLGAPTDPESKRAYYLRVGESRSLAKIRGTEASVLTRDVLGYFDRTVLHVANRRFESIRIIRDHPVTGDAESFLLAREGERWFLREPVDAPADTTAVARLLNSLGNLRASGVVSRTDRSADFGLTDPTMRVVMTYAGIPVIKAGDDGPPVSSPSETKTLELVVAQSLGWVYAKRTDSPVIYRLLDGDYDVMRAEFRQQNVFDFEPSQATFASVGDGRGALSFEKRGDGWVFSAEPDWPVDQKKVTDFVIKVAGMKLKRFVAYGAADLAAFGLDKPARTVSIRSEEGESVVLHISGQTCSKDSDASVYAAMAGTNDVFLLTPDTVSRVVVSLDDFEEDAGA
jgi:Domain of unknown function (DUF4340)